MRRTRTDPPVSVLKPLHGAEPGLSDNLRSFADQDYPAVQLVLGVRDPGDSALPIARALIRDRPDCDIALVINPRVRGSNLKVANLENMLPAARHEWIVLADSDMRVARYYLSAITEPLARPATGLVTCLYKGAATAGLWSRLAAMQINFSLPYSAHGNGGHAGATRARMPHRCSERWPTEGEYGRSARSSSVRVTGRRSGRNAAPLWRSDHFMAETADGREDWTALEYLRRSRLAAYRMLNAGIKRGEPVLVWATSGPHMAAVMVGAWRTGIIPVPLDLRFTADVAQRVAERSGAKWAIVDDQNIGDAALGATQRLNLSDLVSPATDRLPADWEAQVMALPRPTRSDLLAVMYTSGTTGQPRGVMISHGTSWSRGRSGCSRVFAQPDARHLRSQSALISTMPMSHIYGMSGLSASLIYGIQIAFPRSKTPRALVQAIRDYKATSLNGAPRILDIIWRQLVHEIDAEGQRDSFEQRRQRSGRYPYWVRRRMFKRELEMLGGSVKSIGAGAATRHPTCSRRGKASGCR